MRKKSQPYLPLSASTNAVSLADAQQMICNWKEISKSILYNGKPVPQEIVPRAFFIPMSDIMNVLSISVEMGGTGVRAYLSFDSQDSPTGDLKIIIVPCQNNEQDYVAPITGTSVYTIYDLVKPCPPLCDIDSPLNTPDCAIVNKRNKKKTR